MRSEAAATIFSRSNAPPPPLMRLSAGSISSAPSTVRSSRSMSSSVVRRMPHRSASARVASEVGTPITSSPARTRSPSSSTKCFAVEPVPRPSFMPSRTCSSARGGGLPFQFVHGHGSRDTSEAAADRAIRRCPAGACLASFYGEEQRHTPGITVNWMSPLHAPTCMIAARPIAISDGHLPTPLYSISTARWWIPRPTWSARSISFSNARACRQSRCFRRAI